jgi:hypothetical protein
MTVRELASTILRFSIRHASPKGREWGQAMLREMDFVKGDWTALFWAIESAAALLMRSHASMSSRADVLSKSNALMKTVRRRTLAGYAVCLFVILWLVHDYVLFSNTPQKVGSGIIVGGSLYMAYQLYRRRGGAFPPDPGSPAFADSYRAELERQRDFHRGVWLWSRVVFLFPGLLLLCIGFAIGDPRHGRYWATMAASFVIMSIAAVPLNLRLSRKYQRQIDELDALRNLPQA